MWSKSKQKNNVLFVQLRRLTNYVYGTGARISGSGSTIQNCLGSGSTPGLTPFSARRGRVLEVG